MTQKNHFSVENTLWMKELRRKERKSKKSLQLNNIRHIRHDDLVRLYDRVIVKTPQGNRECDPSDVKPGEVVDIPDRLGEYQFFKVLPNLT
jgi:hypothetical protein